MKTKKIILPVVALAVFFGMLFFGQHAFAACTSLNVCNQANLGKNCCTSNGADGSCQQFGSSIVGITYVCVPSISSTGPATGCCAKWDATTSALACYPNYTKAQCKPPATNNPKDIFIPDIDKNDPSDCSGPTAKGVCKVAAVASKKGCCVVLKPSNDPNCLTNKTEQECRDTAAANSGFQFGGWYNDADCLVTTQNGNCRGNNTNNNLQGLQGSTTTGTTGNSAGASTTGTITFTNPLGFSTVEDFFGSVLGTLRGIIIILSLIFIVLGGVMYIVSAGQEKMMTTAKGAITAAMIGLAIGIAAPSFLKEISTILGWSGGSGIAGLTMTEIALNFLNFLLAIVGILALIMLIVGGIMYLTSAGDEDRVKTGKKIVTYSIIGIAIALASMVIVRQIANLLK